VTPGEETINECRLLMQEIRRTFAAIRYGGRLRPIPGGGVRVLCSDEGEAREFNDLTVTAVGQCEEAKHGLRKAMRMLRYPGGMFEPGGDFPDPHERPPDREQMAQKAREFQAISVALQALDAVTKTLMGMRFTVVRFD